MPPMSAQFEFRVRGLVVSAIALALAVLTGCSGVDQCQVTGRVTRTDGTPVAGARVMGDPGGGGTMVYGITDGEGHFALSTGDPKTGVPPGDYQVGVVEDVGDPERPKPRTVAAKYARPASSGFSFSVAAGDDHRLDLILDPP